MSSDEHDNSAEYFARMMMGGRTADQEFVEQGRSLFAINIVIALFKKDMPDVAMRLAYVDKYVMVMQQKADQELAEHRQMTEDSPVGKLLGAVTGTPEALSESTEKRFSILRAHLRKLVT